MLFVEVLFVFDTSKCVNMPSKELLQEYVLPILATATALLTWYIMLLGCQSRIKRKLNAEYEEKGEVFDRYFGQDPRMLAVDRIVANTHEQIIPFLCAMWIHATFVSPTVAGILGFIWVALRIIYTLLMPKALENINPKRLFASTLPQYLIIWYLFLSTAIHALIAVAS